MKKYAYQLWQPCFSGYAMQDDVVYTSPYRYSTAIAALQAGIKAIVKSGSVNPEDCDYTRLSVRESNGIVGIIYTDNFRLYVD